MRVGSQRRWGLGRPALAIGATVLTVAVLLSDFTTQWWPSKAITAGLVSSAIIILITVLIVDRQVEDRRARRLQPLVVVALDDCRREMAGARFDRFDEGNTALSFRPVLTPNREALQSSENLIADVGERIGTIRREWADLLARWSPLLGSVGIDDELLKVADAYAALVEAHDDLTALSRELWFNQGAILADDDEAWSYLADREGDHVASLEKLNAATEAAFSAVSLRLAAQV